MTIARVLVAQMTVVHVEDEMAFEYLLQPLFQGKGFHYERVSLLSEAWDYLDEPNVVGFIFDLRLPHESPAQFARWAGAERTPAGLIRKIHGKCSALPVVVLTDFPDDTPLRQLLQAQILRPEDIFKKSDQRDEALEALVERFQTEQPASFRSKHSAPTAAPVAVPVSVPLPANMDLRLLHLVEKARRGLLSRATASTKPGEIPVLARVNDLKAWKKLPGVRPGIAIPRPGGREWIVTGRLLAEQAEQMYEHMREQTAVLSLEAAQLLMPQLAPTREEVRADAMVEALLDPEKAGKGVVIGFVDYGCDFAHPNFRLEAGKGSTRVLALWQQDAKITKGAVKFGALRERSDLDAALATKNPYKGYSVSPGSHGTHVMDIAAGGGAGTGVPGIAPSADLVFVELSEKATAWGEEALDLSLMDSVHLLEAVTFIFRWAGDRPCVVNLSLGSALGAHDGTSLVEIGIDDLVATAPNRAVVVAASNSYELGAHASGSVSQDEASDLRFQVEEGLCAILDLWYGSGDRFAAEIFSPSGEIFGKVELGVSRSWPDPRGGLAMKLVHQEGHPDNGDNRIQLFLEAGANAGVWRLRLHGVDVQDGHFHTWIEGDLGKTPHSFLPPHDKTHTLGSLGCGHESIAVGAYNLHDDCKPCSFSSAGPTRDERLKPDLSAPGEGVLAAQSGGTEPIARSGTSMAAPVVTGITAVLLSEARALGISLKSHEIRDILRAASRLDPPKRVWHPRYGWGRIDARAAISALQKWKSSSPDEDPTGGDT